MPLPVLGKIWLTEEWLNSYFLLLSDWKSPQRLEKLLQQLFQVGEGSDYDKMWVRGNKCWGRVTKGSRVPTIASPPSPSAKLGLAGHGGQLSEEEVEDNRITAPPFPPLVLMMPPSAEPSRPPILVLAELGPGSDQLAVAPVLRTLKPAHHRGHPSILAEQTLRISGNRWWRIKIQILKTHSWAFFHSTPPNRRVEWKILLVCPSLL